MKLILSLLLACVCLSSASETDQEKTTEAVAKAVVTAENKPEGKVDKEASAVSDATMAVIKTESEASQEVPDEVLEKARAEAKSTFKELRDAKVGTKAAADAAAKVAVAEVDGASDMAVASDVKENAEKAAVAAGKGLADHPTDGAKALVEAITTVKKEEDTPGKVDVKAKGTLAKAKETFSELPSLTEGVVQEQGGSVFGAFAIFASVVALGAIGRKTYKEHFELTPYMKSLRMIRDEQTKQGDSQAYDVECTTYSEMH